MLAIQEYNLDMNKNKVNLFQYIERIENYYAFSSQEYRFSLSGSLELIT
jgi:hypothetical protein